MNLAQHTIHTRSVLEVPGLRFRLKLIVVRLASGVPWAGKGLPFPFLQIWVALQVHVFGQR